jgi:hypothetical protein
MLKNIKQGIVIISFGPNPRTVAKFQTDRFRTFEENPREKKIKKIKKPTRGKTYTLAAATLRYADTVGSIIAVHNQPRQMTNFNWS